MSPSGQVAGHGAAGAAAAITRDGDSNHSLLLFRPAATEQSEHDTHDQLNISRRAQTDMRAATAGAPAMAVWQTPWRLGERVVRLGAAGSEFVLQARDVNFGAGRDQNALVDRDELVSGIRIAHHLLKPEQQTTRLPLIDRRGFEVDIEAEPGCVDAVAEQSIMPEVDLGSDPEEFVRSFLAVRWLSRVLSRTIANIALQQPST